MLLVMKDNLFFALIVRHYNVLISVILSFLLEYAQCGHSSTCGMFIVLE